MMDEEKDLLAGQRVAFTGRASSFRRERVRELVEGLNGIYQSKVDETTTLLVMGAAGWPLQKNGRLTRNLEIAQRLLRQGHAICIEDEEAFLRRIGAATDSPTQVYSLPQLSRMLNLSAQQLQAWLRLGLIQPAANAGEIDCFDFQQVVRCRTLADLAKSRAGRRRLRRAIRLLRQQRLHEAVFDQLVMLDSGLAVRQQDGRLCSLEGQFLIDFSAAEEPSLLPTDAALDTDFERAVELELAGQLQDAEECYRMILRDEPDDADVLFNLANVLVQLERAEEAIEVYRNALYAEPEFKEAWNNLGNSLADLGKLSEALLAFQQALLVDAEYASACYGLARTLELSGRQREAVVQWQRYLEMTPEGECAEYARQRLEAE